MASLWDAKGASSDDAASSGIWFDPSSICQEIDMEQILINLVAGAIGGVGVGKSSSTFDLGTAGNEISSRAWSEAGFWDRSLPSCCLPSWRRHNQETSV